MGVFLILLNYGAAAFNLWVWTVDRFFLNLVCFFVSLAVGSYILGLEMRR